MISEIEPNLKKGFSKLRKLIIYCLEECGSYFSISLRKNTHIIKSGAWFSFKDMRIGQGRENTRLYLKDNPEIAAEIENMIRQKYSMPCNE